MEERNITKRILGDDTILINPGRVLDNNNAHEMATAISAAQVRGFRFIIIDAAELEFISSAGVGSIVGAVETSREAGGDILLCNISSTVQHILNVLDLADYLTIKATTEEAVALCGMGP